MTEPFNKAFRNAHRVSPSQVDTILLCERKWGFEKLDGLSRPPNKYAQTGLEAHEVLELWQGEGRSIDLSTPIGAIVSPGLKFLPRPGTHATEHDFVFDTGRVVFHGRIDLRGSFHESVQTVWDHKTTSSFNWLKTPQFLRRDPQAVIYGKAAEVEARRSGLIWGQTLERIELNWVYYLANPKTPRSRKVQLNVIHDESVQPPPCPDNVRPEHYGVMTLAELDARFIEMEKVGVQILTYRYRKFKARDLPYNVAACGAYGGCHYQDNPCTLTLSERIEAMEANEQSKNLSLSEKIQRNIDSANAGGNNASGTTATAAAPAAAPIPPTPPQGEQPAAESPAASPPASPPSPPPGLAAVDSAPPQGQQGTTDPDPLSFKLVKGEGGQPPPAQSQEQQPPAQPAAATQPTQVNPPEKDKGVDPDGPAVTAGKEKGGVTRAEMVKAAMRSLIEARVYSVEDNRYEVKIANQAVKLADTAFATMAAKK
ncbi:MAG: hypothetical protein ACE5F6_00125 [Anaerolineae bacterium]